MVRGGELVRDSLEEAGAALAAGGVHGKDSRQGRVSSRMSARAAQCDVSCAVLRQDLSTLIFGSAEDVEVIVMRQRGPAGVGSCLWTNDCMKVLLGTDMQLGVISVAGQGQGEGACPRPWGHARECCWALEDVPPLSLTSFRRGEDAEDSSMEVMSQGGAYSSRLPDAGESGRHDSWRTSTPSQRERGTSTSGRSGRRPPRAGREG